MINLLYLLILTLVPPTTAVDSALQEQIPALDADQVRAILLFEIEGLREGDVVVEEVKQLGDKAKAAVSIRGERKTVNLVCRMGDFGPVWDLAGSVEESIVPSEELPTPSTEPEITPAQETEPTEEEAGGGEPEIQPVPVGGEASEYQDFLSGFVMALREGREEDFESFYYKESDFDMDQVEGTPDAARAKFSAELGFFIKACSEVSGLLRGYQSFEIISVAAAGVPARVKRRLSTWMPTLVDFYGTAYIEVELDGDRGMISVDGLAMLKDGWRIGAIADYQLPSSKQEQQPQ